MYISLYHGSTDKHKKDTDPEVMQRIHKTARGLVSLLAEIKLPLYWEGEKLTFRPDTLPNNMMLYDCQWAWATRKFYRLIMKHLLPHCSDSNIVCLINTFKEAKEEIGKRRGKYYHFLK